MKADERLKRMGAIEHMVSKGSGLVSACFAAGVSRAWYQRWSRRYEAYGYAGLSDLPRTGRPRKNRDGE